MDHTPQRISVAVVKRDDCVLIGQRPEGVALAGYWEFPGGKIQDRESPGEAAQRECLEETGLQVDVTAELARIQHEYAHGRLELYFFQCALVADSDGLPSPPFHWVNLAELDTYRFPPANDPIIARLLAER